MKAFERFLRLDRPMEAAALLRARITAFTALLVIALQFVNQVVILNEYAGWTVYSTISTVAIILLGFVMVMPRYTTSAVILGGTWSVLVCAAVGVAVLNGSDPISGGINTTLLPMLIASPILVAMAGNWRMCLLHSAAVAAMLIGMHGLAMDMITTVQPGVVLETFPGRFDTLEDTLAMTNSQRLSQGLIALTMVTLGMGTISAMLTHFFSELEANVSEARASRAEKGDFLARMSHEIRTPLNGIVAMSELLDMHDLPEPSRRPAQIISDASQRLLEIVDDVLDHERLEAGRLHIMEEPFDLRHALSAVLDLHRQSAHDKRVWLGLEWLEGLPERVVGDRSRISQIVGNFVSNAIKFTDQGGVRVVVRGDVRGVGATGARVRLDIVVQDTGAGIAEDELGSVFEQYRQSASGRGQGSKGTGLGLAISKELAELMGGSVGVRSEVGTGSAFHVTLDLPVVEESLDIPEDRVA